MKKETFIRSEKNPAAVVNIDNDGLQAYKLKKKNNKKVDDIYREISKINKIESEIESIKMMLSKIVEKL